MEKEIELEQEAIVVYSGGGAVNSVNGYTGDVVLTTSDLENTSDYQTGTEVESAISTAIAGKQDTLTAGNNITISNNTISATDTTYTAGTGLDLNGTQFSVDTTAIATQSDLTAGLATKQDTLTAGANIQINNNTISATDTTYSAFTGTDGQTAGTAGLVPAPATTDAGKFLKADGTWDTAGGGGGSAVKTLTAADFNWNLTLNSATEPYDCVALWLLEPGTYNKTVASGVPVAVHANPYGIETLGRGTYIVATETTNPDTKQILYTTTNSSRNWYQQLVTVSNGTSSGTRQFIMDNNVVQTTGTSTTDVMSQKAVTDELYPQYSSKTKGVIGIGDYSSIANYGDTKIGIGRITLGNNSAYALAINSGDSYGTVNSISGIGIWSGTGGTVTGVSGIAIGSVSSVSGKGGVAIGRGSSASTQGEFNIGSSDNNYGYNSSNYRLLTGLYDPQSAHDAATKGYVDNSLLGKANKISVVQTSDSTIEINPNTFYKFGEVASLNITLASITDNTIYNEYMFEFVSGTTATTLTLPSSIKWLETPTIDANKIYQCSIVDNVGLLVGVTNV